MNSSFRLVETDFLSSGNSILLFRALLKFWKFGGGNYFKKNYSRKLFYIVEINFFHFLDIFASESYFSSRGNVFLNEFFILYGGDGFLSGGNCFFFI